MKKSARSVQNAINQGYASRGGIRRLLVSPDDKTHPQAREGWVRGKAVVEGGWVILKQDGRHVFQPETEKESVLLALVNLKTHDHTQIEAFVARYGLLSDEGLLASKEPLQMWIDDQRHFSNLLNIHYRIENARNDKPRAFHEIARLCDAKYFFCKDWVQARGNEHSLDENERLQLAITQGFINLYEKDTYGKSNYSSFTASQKSQLIGFAMKQLAQLLDQPLAGGIDYRISCTPLPEPKRKDDFVRHSMGMDYRAIDLHHYLYLQLSFLSIDSRPIGRCSCGRYFPLTRSDRLHCSPECGGTKRSINSRRNRNEEMPAQDSPEKESWASSPQVKGFGATGHDW